MRSRTNDIVSSAQVEDLAGGILQQALRIIDHGIKCTAQTIWLVLLFATSRRSSIYDACQRLRDAPTDQAIRNALADWSPGMTELERRLNRALVAKLPKSLRGKSHPMVIDTSDICYYGQPWKRKCELRRGKRKQGTSRFHCYATLYIPRRGQRFTIAVTYVWKQDSYATIVRRLVEQAKAVGLRPRYVLLDRGFYRVDVVDYLKSVRCPFLMPVVHHGRRSKKPLAELKGTRRFLRCTRSGWSGHTMQRQNRAGKTEVRICVACRRKKDQRGGRPLVFAFWGFRPQSPAWVREEYRRRFGIESSYRQMNQGRARTCSRDPRMRLLLVGIGLVLRNVWVWLHHTVLGRARGRGVELHLERLRLRTLLLMLQRCAEAVLGCTEDAQELVNARLPPLSVTLS